MSAPLFVVDELPAGPTFTLDGPEGHHAATVQRLQPGEELLLCNGRGGSVRATVVSVAKGSITVALGERALEPASAPRLIAVQALAKGDRGELAVQTMTEVGVDVIVPWAASRSVVRWKLDRGDRSRQRWVDITREAAKQSRRSWFPEVAELHSTEAVRDLLGDVGAGGLVLHEEATVALATVDLPAGQDLVVVIGPEGGIAPDELTAFTTAGATPVRLGRSVLRTSTAGVAALAALSVRLARWS